MNFPNTDVKTKLTARGQKSKILSKVLF